MSVTFHLYKPIDAYTIPDQFYMTSPTEYKKLLIEKPQVDPKYDAFWSNFFKDDEWNDGKTHQKLNLTYLKALAKGKKNRLSKMIQKIENQKDVYKIQYLNSKMSSYKYIAVDEVLYRQGWFLKKKFFKKVNWTHIYTTKEEMLGFFKRYIDFTDPRGAECAKVFLEAWKDGMIFECSW